jgi:1-aminocyclopropane-1-carboxylate deaminase
MLRYSPTPIQEILDSILDKAGVRLLIKREDLNHPLVSGNKWWKLKYNLQEAKRLNKKTLLTFGGAYSNHIFATAVAANELGFNSIGIIRGEETLPLNHTLSFAKSNGMSLICISREQYRQKTEPEFLQSLQKQFGDFYLIPEGGTNELAVASVTEFAQTLKAIEFNYLCCSVGTGGTLAGLITGVSPDKNVLGFSSLKGGEFLKAGVHQWLKDERKNNWDINTHYHFGGYGKQTESLNQFMNDFRNKFQIQLDPVYTAKMMAGIFDLIEKEYFKPGSVILALHTGGLQGKQFTQTDR